MKPYKRNTSASCCKRLLRVAVLSPLCLFCSCLSEDPKGALEEGQAYNNATQLELSTVAPLYNYIGGHAESEGLQGTYRGVYDLNTFTTDEAMLPTRGGDWYDGGFWQNLYLHKWTASDGAFNNTWNYLYKVVMLCNSALSTLQANSLLLTEAQQRSYEAEVRCIRAMFYFYLMDLYGQIPLVTSSGTALEDVRQSERSKTFRFVFDELQTCAPLLSDAHSNLLGDNYGRMTRPVAYFLLAKLALNAEIYSDDDWTDSDTPDGSQIFFKVGGGESAGNSSTLNAWETCIYYCDRLTDAGYTLETDYEANFAVHNETSKENIFTIPMDKYLYANQFKNLFRSRHYSHGSAIGMDAENGSSATVSTCNTYGYGTDDVDTRWDINFYADLLLVDGNPVLLSDGTPLVYQPLEVCLDLTGSPYEKTAGARMAKYEIDLNAYADGALQGNDIVLFRYADALLMKAEAKIRNGQDGSTELNQVRTRAGMPPIDLQASTPDASLSTLLAERLRELMWEGWRRNDLIRFRLFHKAYDQRPQAADEQTAFTTVFPIPNAVIDHNANIRQNPKY
ncbi:MAG: RagB/SusD family nutrient uptake outer membrane protein [Prevotella sp.]|nr:RagB/SusD family nutrient uptake outer membrane protein [Prevotella sp.]